MNITELIIFLKKCILTLCLLCNCFNLLSQDVSEKKEKYIYNLKIGAKLYFDRNKEPLLSSSYYTRYNYGLQISKKLNNSISSIETGVYLINNTIGNIYDYEFLCIPINYRIDIKYLYFTGGFLLNTLIKKSNNSPEINRNFLGYNIGIGVEKNFTNGVGFFVEPRTLNIPDKNKFLGALFINYGLGIGLNYCF
jgi:hypothetical protein